MRPKTAGLHPRLVLLAVAVMASVLFVVSCGGGGEATEVAQVPEAVEETEAAPVPEVVEAVEAADEGQPKRGGTLKFAMFPNEVTLDPPLMLGETDVAITQQVYDNLLMIQPDLTVKPELATSWEPNEDFSSYTFHLREGVKFHHGKDFKAEDVVFSFNRLLDPEIDSPIRPTFETIDEMVIIDDYTIRFDLTGPNAFFPDSLSVYQARITPSDVDIERFHLEAIGTGPFILVEHLVGERSVFERNPDYWEEGKPYFDEIIIQLIREAATRTEALKSGDVDVVNQLPAQDVETIEAHSETIVLEKTSPSWIGLVMDNRVPPFDNLKVRKAMQLATDREAIRQASMLGRGSIAYDHPIPPNSVYFAPQHQPPDYDPEAAKQLLAEAGYPDGIDLTLYTADVGTGMIELAVAFKESVAPAGINVDVVRKSSDGFWDVVWMVEPFTIVYWYGRANPDQALSIQNHSDSSWNAPRYVNPKLDELIEKARGQDLEGQKESYAEIQKILIDNVPRLTVGFQPWMYGARSNVRGIQPHPLAWPVLQDGWFDN